MDLGAFSISLAVKDLATSRAFYEKLGFTVTGGDGESWQILRNGETTLGLFQGMFEGNLLTFNPGIRGSDMSFPDAFTDVRDIQAQLDAAGVPLTHRADPDTVGPAHLTLVDPDGNVILIDQHR